MLDTTPLVGRPLPPVRLDINSPTGLVYDGGPKDGQKVGGKSGKYWMVKHRGEFFLAHRLVYELHSGETLTENDLIDHWDKNGRNNKPDNLRKVDSSGNSRNRKAQRNSPTGISGVSFCSQRPGSLGYWVATWSDHLTLKPARKYFSVAKLGNDEARRQATAYRLAMLETMNAQGAGYSPTHGV